jgi:hypothetical protein
MNWCYFDNDEYCYYDRFQVDYRVDGNRLVLATDNRTLSTSFEMTDSNLLLVSEDGPDSTLYEAHVFRRNTMANCSDNATIGPAAGSNF